MSLTGASGASNADLPGARRLTNAEQTRATPRWAGVFRRMEHVRDPAYRQVDVAICGAICEVAVEADVELPPCPVCRPEAAD
ncbi:hypothetical protein [Actinoalloteichus hymeniacidonis]|uniref:Uncharacterized protein n=1 Tax=Actinoalloteichus hymeniacidonis TaxID=340345 RepID=A0AAC9HR50_9PSEU|nr:hypothetical protein [Actinoalloteichus hymeniacidonis]AOS63903.1 hypothetical protein TL08_15470 [Actinoalloteichus hymeniacidonis]MBB5908041.1 hypothetical protein [Actinoalloteichus hymeniacidonis]